MKIGRKNLLFFLSLMFNFALLAQDNSKINVDEITEKQLEALDKDINLDDFQKLELWDFLLNSTKKIKEALDGGRDPSDMRFLVDKNNLEFDIKLKEVLLPEQFDKYMELKRERAIKGEEPKMKAKKQRRK